MGEIAMALLWIVSLIPIFARLWGWGSRLIKGLFAIRGASLVANMGKQTVIASLLYALIASAGVGVFVLMAYDYRIKLMEMFGSLMSNTIFYVIGRIVDVFVTYLPSATANEYFSKMMSIIGAFDIATPIHILIIGYCISVTIGAFMRMLKL